MASYPIHLRLIGKHTEDVLFVIIELFQLGNMAEALRANMDSK